MFPRRLRVVVAVLLGVALTFVILDLRGGQGPFTSVRNVAASILGGVERGAATIFSPITGFADFWTNTRDQKARLDELEKSNAELQSEVKRAADDRARAAALDGMLKVAGLGRYRIVPAEVIAIGPSQDFTWTVTIDAGSDDGIEVDMTVLNYQGLVGRVSNVEKRTSSVVLIVDPSVSVGARVAGSQEIGILSGTGKQNELQYQLLDPLASLDKGAALVTFGSKDGRPYVPGVPIGEVLSVAGTAGQLSRVATVRPFADISTLSIVGVVVRPPRTDPRDSVLPAVPNAPAVTASATPTPSPAESGAQMSVPSEVPAPDSTPSP
ncbi:MAG: rod shape-determining protein MreC [Actinomycetota bacterium]|jgi:rod shape-determining protein MreC